MHELILGGGKSGKSRCAESRAQAWLQVRGRRALLIATALPADQEMRDRIARHGAERSKYLPALETLEVPHELPRVLREVPAADRLVIVDCLTLWVGQQLMPWEGPALGTLHQRVAAVCERVTLMVAGVELRVKA